MIEIALSGRVGGDPDHRTSAGGKPWCKFSLAIDVDPKSRDAGTQWVRCVAFGDKATALQGKLAKGDRAYVEGRLKLPVETYTPRDGGDPRASVEVLANIVQPLGQIGHRRPRNGEQRPATGHQEPDDFDDPIPF